jgi:hypothetical protein
MKFSGSHWRRQKALREGRKPGVCGHPPLSQEEQLPLLASRVRQRILEKQSVNVSVLKDMVFFLFLFTNYFILDFIFKK